MGAANIFSKFSFLIAEDNPANQLLMRGYMDLLKIGDFTLVTDGQSALESYRSSPYDFVIMDIRMPVMDGLEAMQQLRAELHPDTIVIALTAHAMRGDKEKYLAAGFHHYLAKPFRLEDFRAILMSHKKKPRVTDCWQLSLTLPAMEKRA